MHGYIDRILTNDLTNSLKHFPVIAILGPRQCGKSTLAKIFGKNFNNFLYIDLESTRDLNKLNDPEFFFESNNDKIICLDEIHRKPDLFPVIRSIVDRYNRNIKIIVLGSASPLLIKQSSESLAGRIVYHNLTPFTITELFNTKNYSINNHWLKGGFPESYLAADNSVSLQWRDNFILTLLERDIPGLGFNLSSTTLRRFITLCAHSSAQILNQSKIGESLGLSHNTINKYIELFGNIFILRSLLPYYTNIKKRVIKSPKIYFRDSGLLHSLFGIRDFNDLLGHPIFGQSWESFAIEMILSELKEWSGYFYRTSHGAEIDLILESGIKKIAIEFKCSTSPSVSKGFYNCLDDLLIDTGWIICPISDSYPINNKITVSGIQEFIADIQSKESL